MMLARVVATAVFTMAVLVGHALAVPAQQATGSGPPAAAAASKIAPETLDKLLAPVALYPDQLLAQMLLCAENPAKVQELSGWLIRTPELQGTQLQEAAQKAGFDPSYVVLALFPQVVNFMADNIAWTKELGQAFTADRQGVLASVQRLRAQAQKAGNLKTTPQQKVETKTTSAGQQVTVIEPANPQVVYVPTYNPTVVYTQPATTTTVVVKEEDDNDGAAVAGAVVGFAAGIAIGAAMDNDHYYGPYGWHGGPYMYNDAWDDFYDDREDAREDFYENREDAREDWQDNREDLAGERSERAQSAQEQRTERQSTRTESQSARRTEAGAAAQSGSGTAGAQARTAAESRASGAASTQTRSASGTRSAGSVSAESRGTTGSTRQVSGDRSGTRSDAFSGYSSGKSERAASARGQRSRSSGSRGGGRRR